MTLVIAVFFVLLVLGMPVGYVLGIAGMVGLYTIGGEGRFLMMAPKRFFAGIDLFPFLAMPFFILAGEIMNRSGITDRLVSFAQTLVGYLRGGMAHSNMLASVFFAGITGAATADAAAFGNTLVPAMVKQGYTRPFACAVTAAGSIIGPTIPPSTLMVIYGSIMGVSIAGLFAAGIIPGLLICLLCMAVIAALGRRLNLPKGTQKPSLRLILRSFKDSLVALVLPVIILGGILGGITTPTEAASIAVLYALIIGGLVYRAITFQDLLEMLIRTALITGVIFLIISSASILGWWMTFNKIPQAIAAGFLSVTTDPNMIIAMILMLLLGIGMFMDINAVLIILAPVLAPLTLQIGMDPVHAGIMIILALNISLMTPPVGACLFVLASVTGERVELIARSLWPFLLAEVAILFVIAYWPSLTLFLPRLLGFADG
jgi:tripartite ATP-independent transporter DctM subunit